jgi:protein O-mannosyl-transferase
MGKGESLVPLFYYSMDDNRPQNIAYALVLLLFLIAAIYSNTLNVPWHLDDHDNIAANTNIQIERLDPDSIFKSFFWGYGEHAKLQRPVAMFSFALNWFVGQNNVAGYHLLNTIIHFIAALFLFLTILQLYKTPNLRHTPNEDAYFIALLGSLLWAVHPIQTQAVTYIVQRMASMSAMFYIVSIYLYLRGRMSDPGATRGFFWGIAVVSFLLALGTKENTATLPMAVLVVEVIFFQNLNDRQTRKRLVIAFAATVFGVGLIGAFLFLKGDLGAILSGYEVRYFTPLERVLTQPRVLFLYLSQLFYPIPSRLSIAHDIQLSTSFFSPITTLPAILGIMAALVFSIWQMRKRPILSFAVLFFFLNQIIESSIIALELIFEHRNYLPSFFIFWPVAVAVKLLLDHYHRHNIAMRNIIAGFIVLLIVGLGSSTYIRNMAWESEKTMWEDAISKAPNNNRAYHNLALSHYEVLGQFDAAMALYKKALDCKKTSYVQESLTLHGIAGIYYYRWGDYPKANAYWEKAYASFNKNPMYKFQAALALVRMQAFDEALVGLESLLEKHPRHQEALNLSGHILLKLNQPQAALNYFRSVAKKRPFNKRLLLNLGAVFSILKQHDRARLFLREGHHRYPQDKSMLLLLVENSINRKDVKQADIYLNKLFRVTSIATLKTFLRTGSHENSDLPITPKQAFAKVRKQIVHFGVSSDATQKPNG